MAFTPASRWRLRPASRPKFSPVAGGLTFASCEGRGLEAAAKGAVERGAFIRPEQQPQHRRGRVVGFFAAIVRIARDDEVILGAKAHVARAQAAVHGPAIGQLPFRLHVQAGARHGIVLVALECALDAEVVDIATPVLRHLLVLGAEGKPEVPREVAEIAHRQSAETAVEVDYAPRVRRRRLRGERNGEELLDRALAAVRSGLQPAVGEALVEGGANLLMRDALARVEGESVGRRLCWIRPVLGARQAQGVLRIRLLQRVRHQH